MFPPEVLVVPGMEQGDQGQKKLAWWGGVEGGMNFGHFKCEGAVGRNCGVTSGNLNVVAHDARHLEKIFTCVPFPIGT